MYSRLIRPDQIKILEELLSADGRIYIGDAVDEMKINEGNLRKVIRGGQIKGVALDGNLIKLVEVVDERRIDAVGDDFVEI